MRTILFFYTQFFVNLLMAKFTEFESPVEDKKFPVWAIVIIIVGVLLICVLPICIIIILMLMGPAIGEVFEEIIYELE